jgi:hypothetical protein
MLSESEASGVGHAVRLSTWDASLSLSMTRPGAFVMAWHAMMGPERRYFCTALPILVAKIRLVNKESGQAPARCLPAWLYGCMAHYYRKTSETCAYFRGLLESSFENL